MSKHGLADRIDWEMPLLLDADKLPAQKLAPAKQVPSVANVKQSSGRLVLGIVGGGVMIRPKRTFDQLKVNDSEVLEKNRQTVADERGKHWWWDIKPVEAEDAPKKNTSKKAAKG